MSVKQCRDFLVKEQKTIKKVRSTASAAHLRQEIEALGYNLEEHGLAQKKRPRKEPVVPEPEPEPEHEPEPEVFDMNKQETAFPETKKKLVKKKLTIKK